MKTKSKLFEGLVVGDLDELVTPLISVDEYESKISSDDNIVVAFYAADKEPGMDLVRFISKSEIDIIDAELSPVPNEEGKYLCFVEFLRDKTFPEDLFTLLTTLKALTSITKWEFKAYKREVMPVSVENIKSNVRIKKKGDNTKQLESLLMDTNNIKLLQGKLIAGSSAYKVVAIGPSERVMEGYQLGSKPLLLGETQQHRVLSTAFGHNWQINIFDQYVLAVNAGTDQSILLK